MLDLSRREVFLANLQLVWSVIVASVPLIQRALERDMPEQVRGYYERHLAEEDRHAEWLAEDLRSMGVEPAITEDAAMIAGPAYYYVAHGDPQLLLGYMWALEHQPMPLSVVEALERLYGPQAVRTIRVHAENDPGHAKEIDEVIASLPEVAQGRVMKYAAQVERMIAAALFRISLQGHDR